mmetsp:Transcript_67944/g.214895  ORF Transcript_67944/g.214895 Transcript_67944/m.214895 type:complete len:348 (-) Transcript_67944:1057-2100(-)
MHAAPLRVSAAGRGSGDRKNAGGKKKGGRGSKGGSANNITPFILEDIGDDEGGGDIVVEDLFNINTGGWSLEAFGEDDEGEPWLTEEDLNGEGEDDVQYLAGLPMSQKMLKRLKREDKAAKYGGEGLVQAKKARKLLKVISGKCGGLKLLSPSGPDTRPMMEVVRGAVFSMVLSQVGMGGIFPPGSRWLDLYAGTASVGIEALSRGCSEAHFIEYDPWVVANVIEPNIKATKLDVPTVVHTTKAESFLERAAQVKGFAGGAFDFISVTPPYELVDYGVLMASLASSPLVHAGTTIIVEYPRKSKRHIENTCGPLHKLRDRKYGRTYVAIYGPLPEGWEGDEDDDDWE